MEKKLNKYNSLPGMVNSQPIIVRMGSSDRQLSPESDGKEYQKLVTSSSQSKMDLPGVRSSPKDVNGHHH